MQKDCWEQSLPCTSEQSLPCNLLLATCILVFMSKIVLASSSPYRKKLLERLRLTFDVVAPDVDESPHPGEGPEALVKRLAVAKARAVAASVGNALIIGADQVAVNTSGYAFG